MPHSCTINHKLSGYSRMQSFIDIPLKQLIWKFQQQQQQKKTNNAGKAPTMEVHLGKFQALTLDYASASPLTDVTLFCK